VWQALVNRVMNLQVPYKTVNFLLVEQLSVSQKRLGSMEFVNHTVQDCCIHSSVGQRNQQNDRNTPLNLIPNFYNSNVNKRKFHQISLKKMLNVLKTTPQNIKFTLTE
jgi:hypothetical protein